MSDDLKDRRDGKKITSAMQELWDVMSGQEKMISFASWTKENMPIDRFEGGLLVSTFLGSCIGAWLDAGATPEDLKEYLSQFVDVVRINFKQVGGS